MEIKMTKGNTTYKFSKWGDENWVVGEQTTGAIVRVIYSEKVTKEQGNKIYMELKEKGFKRSVFAFCDNFAD